MPLREFAITFGRSTLIREAYRNRGQKHGKREKFRRQPSENVPYKAADVARRGKGNREGSSRQAARGEQEITSPDVRSFGFRALHSTDLEKPTAPSEGECKRGKRPAGARAKVRKG